jgi:hypothetical protein
MRVSNFNLQYTENVAYPSGASKFTPGFEWDSCGSIFSFLRIVLFVCPSSIYASELPPPLLLISPIFSNRGYFIISRHKKGPGGIGVMYLIRPTQTSNAHEEETVDLFFLS